MGGSTSKLVTKSLRDEVLRSTEPTRLLMDRILEFLMREVRPKDFANLASGTECSKYVVFLADTFDKIFVPLRIVPTKDMHGVLMFRKVEDLKDDTKLPNRRALCLSLGYFYTKLFQVLAALSYTVFDESFLRVATGYMIGGPAVGAPLLPPGVHRGGAISESELSRGFKALAPFLTETDDSYVYVFDETRTSRVVTVINIGEPSSTDKYAQIELFSKNRTDGSLSSMKITMDIQIKYSKTVKQDDESVKIYTITIDNVEFYDDTRNKKVATSIKKEFGIYYNKRLEHYAAIQYPRRDMRIDRAIIQAVMNVLADLRGDKYGFGREERRKYQDQFGERLVQREEKERIARLFGDRDRAGEQKRKYDVKKGDASTDERLQALLSAGTRPIAHCIARSLQLLDIDALGPTMPKEARSYICMTRFNEQIQKTVPSPGGSFEKSKGIEALSMLYTVFHGAAPQLLPQQKQEYIGFLQHMYAAMTNKQLSSVPSGADITRYQRILVDQQTDAFCKKMSRDIPLTLQGQSLITARQGVEALFKRQIAHSIQVNKLLAEIFEKTPQGLRIHTQIMRGGIPALDIIAAKTRQILTLYYEGCEMTYQLTLKNLKGPTS